MILPNCWSAPSSTREQVEQIRHRLGLDRSVGMQFVIYAKDLATGNLGTSFIRQSSVVDLIKESLPNTLKLGIPCIYSVDGSGAGVGSFGGNSARLNIR